VPPTAGFKTVIFESKKLEKLIKPTKAIIANSKATIFSFKERPFQTTLKLLSILIRKYYFNNLKNKNQNRRKDESNNQYNC